MASPDIDDCLRVGALLADAARQTALRWFRAPSLGIDNKRGAEGGFDPVTAADRETESRIREILATERPDDGILGEEHETVSGTSGLQWVIDPIDGTRAFMCGLPTWGVLIGLNDGKRPFLGIMDQPFTRERYTGVSHGARCSATLIHQERETAIRTRSCASLGDTVMCSTAPDAFASSGDAAAFDALSTETKLTRYGTDCYGYAMVACGQIDLVVESGLHPYDIQAMIPVVEGAGGVVTDWQGGDCSQGGRVLAAGDAALHAKAVAFLSARV